MSIVIVCAGGDTNKETSMVTTEKTTDFAPNTACRCGTTRLNRNGLAARQLLWAVVFVLAAVGGFYSGFASPRSPTPDALGALPNFNLGPPSTLPLAGNQPAVASLPAADIPPPSPLDFLRE